MSWFKKQQISTTRWLADMSNKADITVDDAKFIFEQAEKHLKNSTDIGTSIVTRTNTLITLSFGILIGLISYVINQLEKFNALNIVGLTCLVGICYIFFVILYTAINIQPSPYYVSGSQPRKLLKDSFFEKTIKSEDRIIRFYVSEIHNYQFRIDVNEITNKKRWGRYIITIWALVLMPIFLLLTFIILYLIL
jgi:hypothetical protein